MPCIHSAGRNLGVQREVSRTIWECCLPTRKEVISSANKDCIVLNNGILGRSHINKRKWSQYGRFKGQRIWRGRSMWFLRVKGATTPHLKADTLPCSWTSRPGLPDSGVVLESSLEEPLCDELDGRGEPSRVPEARHRMGCRGTPVSQAPNRRTCKGGQRRWGRCSLCPDGSWTWRRRQSHHPRPPASAVPGAAS